MKKYVYICDACDKNEQSDVELEPVGWKKVHMHFQYITDWASYLFCDHCLNNFQEMINNFAPKGENNVSNKLS